MKDPELAIGGVTVHRVIDLDPQPFAAGALLPGCDAAAVAELTAVLGPGRGDAERGELNLAMQPILCGSRGGRSSSTPWCGRAQATAAPGRAGHAGRGRPIWRRSRPRLRRRTSTSCCAPLHVDHVGWNTRREDGRWVPTFPRARFVVAQTELDFAARETASDPQVRPRIEFQDSVLPIVEAGLCDRGSRARPSPTAPRWCRCPARRGRTSWSARPGRGRRCCFVATRSTAPCRCCGRPVRAPSAAMHKQCAPHRPAGARRLRRRRCWCRRICAAPGCGSAGEAACPVMCGCDEVRRWRRAAPEPDRARIRTSAPASCA